MPMVTASLLPYFIGDNPTRDAPLPVLLRHHPVGVRVPLRQLCSAQRLVPEGRIAARRYRDIRAQETDPRLLPRRPPALHLRPLHHLGNKRHYVRAAPLPHSERIQPFRIVREIPSQYGSVELLPALLPVIDDGPNRRLVFSRTTRLSETDSNWRQEKYHCRKRAPHNQSL